MKGNQTAKREREKNVICNIVNGKVFKKESNIRIKELTIIFEVKSNF